jgi:hypothetical protein
VTFGDETQEFFEQRNSLVVDSACCPDSTDTIKTTGRSIEEPFDFPAIVIRRKLELSENKTAVLVVVGAPLAQTSAPDAAVYWRKPATILSWFGNF